MGAPEMQREREKRRRREGEGGRELTRDSGSVQHDLDAVSETADL